MKLVFLAAVFFTTLSSGFTTETASFYGASYISVPLQDAKSTTDVQFKFRTRRSDAMLFLAAGRTDYCLIRLETGRLKVHINVGAGETEISSPKGLRLDDLAWHEVVISRRDAAFTLQVDVIHIVQEQLPGRFFELNIHYGLFLGGQGDFSELFLGHLDNLRGCLSDVRYNGVNVLQRARERQGQVDVQGITWTCAPEFDATVDRHISFVEEGAFMTFPNGITRTGVRWQFEVKTVPRRGVLLYNTGLTSRSDFVGVELVDGHLRLLLNKGNGALELRSQWAVSDGKWHEVVVQFNPTFMEISVDGVAVSQRLPQGGSRYLDLAETVFVGGIELNKRSRALGQGLLSADTSFKGCLRGMAVETRRIGIPDARVTQGILPDCVWEYPCSVQDPCVPGSQCLQQGVDSFRCECDQPLCVKPDYAESYKVFSKPTLVMDLEILVLTPLQVAEGDNALITTANIDVVLDYAKFGVRDSGILLYVVEHPHHGKLSVDVWERSVARVMFTMLDLAKDKVRYLHDGTENHQDNIVLELELAPGSGFVLPSYLQGRHRFVLHVNITPINDPPSLTLPPGAVLRLAQGTRKTLSPDILRAEDPDSPSADLVYTVLSQGDGKEKGYVERTQNPGVRIDTFTQLEIDQGLIAYVHRGADPSTNTRLALQVSDGIETSPAAFLRVSSFPLQLRLVNNTGLILTHRAAAHITSGNLTFTSNAEDPDLDVRYEVVKSPQFGSVQRLRGDSQWQAVEHFTSHQIARDQIRYLHTTGDPTHDNFKFKVSVMEVRSPTVYDFRITFTELRLAPVHTHELQLNGTREALLTDKQLMYQTQPLPTESGKIIYQVVRPPRYGALHPSSALKHHRLQSGDTFTQQDLDSARVRYRLHRKAYSHVHDDFTFRVSAPECSSVAGTIGLLHVPSGETRDEVRATLERLQVVEGGRQPVLRTHLDLETNGITELMYNVTHGPHHGRLDVMDVGLVTVLRKNTAYFSSRELMTERVFYVHDDSETRRDSFHFVALSSEEEDFQYVGVFHVDVLLKNDNTPVRAVDKEFQIVINGERLLTGRDLRYSDADIDTQPSDIVYTRRGIPNGGIYRASDPNEPMFEFTQDDLDNFRVLFRHEGDEYGKVGMWVTDGQFYANGVLEVRASSPFVKVSNNTGLVVQRGGAAVLTAANLSAETNLNLWGEQIEFEVAEDPHHGHLLLERDTKHMNRFTQQDLENGHLSYHHDNGTAVNDHFRFRVEAGTTVAEGTFSLRIFPSWYWEPLIVANNRTLHVEESTSVAIAPSFLKVMHPHIPATDITYLVVEPPLYGYLEVLSNQIETDEEPGDAEEMRPAAVTLFDQSLIDDKKLHYIQAGANRTRDKFIVDVTNGISWLRGLVVQFLIVPEWLYISGGELRVQEGESVVLPENLLAVLTEYYRGRVMEYRIIETPRAGSLQSAREPGIPLHRFTTTQLKTGLIKYQHDGSETLGDQFIVKGIAGDKESIPATVKIIVEPVNDEPPHIANNTGLTLWEGATAVITPIHLAAVDQDTGPENLTFTITSSKKGHVALASAPNIALRHFKQSQINSHQLIFVHTGGEGGGFDLTVSDGVKTTAVLSFGVTARKVSLKLIAPQLHVFPMRRQILTPSHLFAVASDPRRLVSYVVKTPPTLGRLMLESMPPGSPRSAVNFTQRDVNSSRLFYEHTHPFFGLSTNDSFSFDVRADFAEPLIDQMLHIDVSVSSGGLDQFVDTPRIIVEEGGVGIVQLNTSGVVSFLEAHADLETTPAILLQLSMMPQHGEVQVMGNNNVTSFTQQQLDAGDVTYHHDHSDTLHDDLHLSLLLEPGDVLLCNITVPIQVQPVNDEPFVLATAAPLMTVVQGQTVPITRENLLTQDPDTGPEGLIYDVINGPSQGRLLFRNETIPVVKFTQADINAERVLYQHSGPLQPAKFYIRVWDGNFNPAYTVFNIHVLPLTLNVTAAVPVMLQQGSSVALITSDHLLAVTNARREEVRYNVTRVPRHGMVYLHDVATRQFGQLDVDKKRVMYMQTDMTTSSDSLQLAAWIPDSSVMVAGLELNVSVEPLLRLGNFTPIAGMKNKITLDVLDATPLAKLTSSNPGYQVLHRPRFGRLKKIIRSSGDRRNMREREVTQFTHEEIKSGVIYYVARRLPDALAHEDNFPFVLAASIFQPAMGELRFTVRPDREGEELTATPTASIPPLLQDPKDPVGHEGGFIVASPNMSSDYVLIVSMVLGVMLLAVLVIVVVKCRSIQVGREESRTCKTELPPVPLPRPPDVLQPTSPHPKRFASNGSSPTPGNTPLPAPASVLQCKVIPLEPVDSVASSEPDLNARYPYGVSDEPVEDWSSYDTSELGYPPRTTNPMLRRNQYWV